MHSWTLRAIGIAVAVLLAGLLVAGIAGVYRAMKAPEGYDQSRLHWNTKNTTRFAGADLADRAALVSPAVFPTTNDVNRPNVVVVYDDADWRGGLVAASLLRPLGALLLPETAATREELARLRPRGSAALGGAEVAAIGGAAVPEGFDVRRLDPPSVQDIATQVGEGARDVLVVARDGPATGSRSTTSRRGSGKGSSAWPG